VNLNHLNQGTTLNAYCLDNLREILKNNVAKDKTHVNFPDSCPMGKWLSTAVKSDPTNTEYQRLSSVHASCHTLTAMALKGVVPPAIPPIVIDGKLVAPAPTFESLAYDLTTSLEALKAPHSV